MRLPGIAFMMLLTLLAPGGAGCWPGGGGAAGAQQTPPEYPWTGKTADGKVITKDELARLLGLKSQGPEVAGQAGKKPEAPGTDLSGADLRGVNLTGVNLMRPILNRANLKESNLSGAYLFEASLSGANLQGANLQDAILYRPNLREADLQGADLAGAGLSLADLSWSNLSRANLTKAYLRVNLYKANLRGANLTEANLRRANLSGANLTNADLSKANLREGVLVEASLRDANLSGADLSEADLGRAILSGARLMGADLRGADLKNARLARVNLRGAKLSGANLKGADLRGAIFEPLPGEMPPVGAMAQVRGLAELWCVDYPQPLVSLREAFKKAGYDQQEREVACSLKRTDTYREWQKGGLDRVKAALCLVFFDLTCSYGLSLWRPLALWGLGVLIFAPFYCLALISRRADTGVWRVWPRDRVLRGEGQEQPEKLTAAPPRPRPAAGAAARGWWQVKRAARFLGIGFYFSLVAALSLSWRGGNRGALVSRLQTREYTLRAAGWVRSLAGLQSLLSALLLVLWAILAAAGLLRG
jgi:uncharacterized protein YjbI with pentapeptide repeats